MDWEPFNLISMKSLALDQGFWKGYPFEGKRKAKVQ
jgi:hypothetical protein